MADNSLPQNDPDSQPSPYKFCVFEDCDQPAFYSHKGGLYCYEHWVQERKDNPEVNPAPAAPAAPNVDPVLGGVALTETERDLLAAIAGRLGAGGLAIEFLDHLDSWAYLACMNLIKLGYIYSNSDAVYQATDAGRRALEASKGGQS